MKEQMHREIQKYRGRAIATLLLVLCSLGLWGQQDPQYTQYIYNTISVNPAYAGSRGHLSAGALYRAQWVGIEGAPVTQTINFHTPIGYKGLGVGFSGVNDEIGPTSETYIDLDLSYTIQTSREARLSFGLKASANLLNIRFSELNQFPGANDRTLEVDVNNRFSPNVGAGVYYHTERFYAGLSVPRILATRHFDETSISTASEQANLYFLTGYVWDLNDNVKFKPTLLTRAVRGAPIQVDLSANFLFNEKFVLGAAYRLSAAVSALAGFQATEEFFLGVAYDRETTDLGGLAFNNGSFEVILRYDFIRSVGSLKSPRFF